MAFTLEYFSKWIDHAGLTHEVRLLQDSGPGNNTEITKQQQTPWQNKRRTIKDVQLKNNILGSEYSFAFMVDFADITDFDAILESNYKEWKMEKYYNSSLEWVGWVLPENAHRPFIKRHSHYELTLTATDGLSKLKPVEYKDFTTGNQFTDRVSIIQTIKRALEHLELELDFRVQLNTYETALMTSSECALDKGTITNYRFTKTEDGREYNESCYAIIESSLKDFNCYLIQQDGYYWIINPQEIDSYYYPITWSGLTVGTRTAHDLEVDLTGYNYSIDTQLEKIRPLEEFHFKFNDRNTGENLLSNGDFSTASTSEWTDNGEFQNFDTLSYGPNYELRANINVDLLGAPSSTPQFYSDAESITFRAEGDQIKVEFKLRCTDMDMDAAWSGPDYYEKIAVKCRLRRGSPTGDIINSTSAGTITVGAFDSTYTTYTRYFPLTTTANYYIEFLIDEITSGASWTDYDNIEVRFDDIFFTVVYSDGTDITFDRYYKTINDDSEYLDVESDNIITIGDSGQDNDLGAIMVSGTRTSSWNRFGKTDNKNLQFLYGQNIIENFAKYKDYVKCKIFDPDHNIKSYSILNINSKLYQIIGETIIYEKGLRKEIKCDLIEILNAAVTTTQSVQNLTSVDGESTDSIEVISSAGLTDIPTLDDVTDVGATTTNEITTGGIDVSSGTISIGNWTIQLNSDDLEFDYDGTVVAKLTTSGYLSVANDIELFDTGL